MERRLIEADAELVPHLEAALKDRLRYLRSRRFVLRPDDYRVTMRGEEWVKRDGVWETERDAVPLRELRRNGRAPIVIDGDTLDALAAAHAARPSASDIGYAMRGLRPTPVEDPLTGEVRVDYANIPLKNADGTLTKYAKNLMDLHAPAIEKSKEASAKMAAVVAKHKESG